jgi:hypothetical protein
MHGATIRYLVQLLSLAAGNFIAVSDTLFKLGVLTDMNCFVVLGVWLVTTPTGCDELAAACTIMFAVFEVISAILTFPSDVNVLHNILLDISLLCHVSVDLS